MNLQVSLPYLKKCVFQCAFCVSCTHDFYKGEVLEPKAFADALMEEVTNSKYDAIVLTGENEPLQSMDYVTAILDVLPDDMKVEMTCRGYKLNELSREQLSKFRLINFSIVNDYKRSNSQDYTHQMSLARMLKKLGVRVRFTYLMTKQLSPHQIREAIRIGVPDEITLKKLQGDTDWIKRHGSTRVAEWLFSEALGIKLNGEMSFLGARFTQFSYMGREIWIDMDCQNGAGNYVIMRADGKVYDSWTSTEPMIK